MKAVAKINAKLLDLPVLVFAPIILFGSLAFIWTISAALIGIILIGINVL